MDISIYTPFTANYVMHAIGSSMIEPSAGQITTMVHLRKRVKRFIEPFVSLKQKHRLAIRKTMSRFWGNSSIFSLDLVGAVVRQGTFIEKMHAIDWLHSPAVSSTMSRLPAKYERFFKILKLHKHNWAVPTLDVDLAWHTHQLHPVSYYEYSVRTTDRFINHDDKMYGPILSTAFEWTSKKYQSMFHEIYSECTCWYCEAVRETHNSTASRLLHPTVHKKIDNQLLALDRTNMEEDPKPMPHISAHNAIDIPKGSKFEVEAKAKQQALEEMYDRSCNRKEKGGKKVSGSEDGHSGEKSTRPYYLPYAADPDITADVYPGNPACVSYVGGAMGRCVA
ncbi:MAG: hypothetical protein Q9168_004010 [Polycauliona sp. 1 TL-2023]